jgi:hypothetical protein
MMIIIIVIIIIKHEINTGMVKRSVLDDIKNNFNGMDIFKEWKREDCQKK